MMDPMKHIVIIGGGFGGIKTARYLAKHPNLFRVTLISDQDRFRYYPALYRTATGHSMRESYIPLAQLLKNLPNLEFIHKKVTTIDRTTKTITLDDTTTINYDTAVFAMGVMTSYFNIPGIEEFSHGLKTIEQIEQLHHDLHEEFIDDNLPDKNYVIVGAGPTGVELAASLRSYLQQI